MRTCQLSFVLLINSIRFCAISAAKNEKWSYSNPNVFMEEGSGCSLMTRIDCKVVGGDLDGEDCLDISPNIPFLKVKESECPLEPISAKVTFEICNIGTHNSLIIDEKKTVMRLDKKDVTPSWIFQNPLDPEKCITYSQVHELNGCRAYEDAGVKSTNLPIYVRVKAFSDGISDKPKVSKRITKKTKQSKCKCSTFRTSSYQVDDTEMRCVNNKKPKSAKSLKSAAPSFAPSTSGPVFSDKLLSYEDDYNVTVTAARFSEAVYKHTKGEMQQYMRNRGFWEFVVTKFVDTSDKVINNWIAKYDTQAAVGIHNADKSCKDRSCSGKKHIFVAFRGSQTDVTVRPDSFVIDWFSTDLDITPTPYQAADGKIVMLHGGFYYALFTSGILDDMEKEVMKLLEGNSNDLSERIIITGHSLGAALGQIFSAYMAQEHPMYNFELITFGAPKVSFSLDTFGVPEGSSSTFKAWAESLTNLSMWGLSYDKDMVTRYPWDWLGYESTGHLFQIYEESALRENGKSKAFYRHTGKGIYAGVSNCWAFAVNVFDHQLSEYIKFLEEGDLVTDMEQKGWSDYWPRWFQEKKECDSQICKWNIGWKECLT